MYYDSSLVSFFFFFNDTATTEIYTLSLHDALPICFERLKPLLDELYEFAVIALRFEGDPDGLIIYKLRAMTNVEQDRKSTRLNSSHANISYAVFCLKKKKKNTYQIL